MWIFPLLVLRFLLWMIFRSGIRMPVGRFVPSKATTAREVLDQRYAAGEINREDYQGMKQDLKEAMPRDPQQFPPRNPVMPDFCGSPGMVNDWMVNAGCYRIARLVSTAYVLTTLAIFTPGEAQALPAFAAQTGEACSACHIGFPQLTPYGRQFKLEGYIASGSFPTWQNFAMMSQTGFTQLHDKVPGGLAAGFKSNDAWAAQQTSLFYGGALDAALGLGAFMQVTYDGVTKQWHWDNIDIRLAQPGMLFGKQLFYGLTFNNAPTVTDLWNSTPSWSFPYISSELANGPVAQQQITALAQSVYGIGAYGALNVTRADMIYAEADLYKSLPNQMGYALGVGPTPQIDGVIPYVRLAFQ